MPGNVIWTVLMSRDLQAAVTLYEGALGWKFERCQDAPLPCWIGRGAGDRAFALFMDTKDSDFPAAMEVWLPCLSVENLADRVRRAEEFGATLLRPLFEVPNFGRIALLRQPGGAIVAWMRFRGSADLVQQTGPAA